MSAIGETAAKLSGYGMAVFPLWADKTPACENGFKDAIKGNPDAARKFCQRGELLGIATGEISGFDALDLDYPRHPEIFQLVERWRKQLPAARMQRTRSGGEHWLFRHRNGQKNTAGLVLPGETKKTVGVDRRGDGGYIVWWPSAGMPVLRNDPIPDWPVWLIDELDRIPEHRAKERNSTVDTQRQDRDYALNALRWSVRNLSSLKEGSRNAELNRSTFLLTMNFVKVNALSESEVVTAMSMAAKACGLLPVEIEKTIDSAISQGRLAVPR